ncbi:MAG: manganese catalase family protein [Afipia sp.]
MYHHVKKLMFTVRVDEPDPRFGNMLLEQFGGANGELAAATARNLAQQLRHTAIVALLNTSLAEEENADQLLNQVSRSLMSVARMPAAIEQTQ